MFATQTDKVDNFQYLDTSLDKQYALYNYLNSFDIMANARPNSNKSVWGRPQSSSEVHDPLGLENLQHLQPQVQADNKPQDSGLDDIFSKMDNFSLTSSEYTSSSCSSSSGDEVSSKKPAKHEKTVLCKYFLNGDCSRGSRCSFAHGVTDLKLNLEQDNPNKKTKLCRNLFEEGSCPFSINCNFAHNLSELRPSVSKKSSKKSEESWRQSAAKMKKSQGQVSELKLEVFDDMFERGSNHGSEHDSTDDSKLYKTRICKHYFKTGKCWLQDQCRFAHGKSELRAGA